MGRYSGRFSFLLLVVAAVIMTAWTEIDFLVSRAGSRMKDSVYIYVYVKNDTSQEELKKLEKLLDSYPEISVRDFMDSDAAIEKLKEEPEIAPKLDMLKEEFSLPASFELSANALNSKRINMLAGQISDYSAVEYVDVPEKILGKFEEFAQFSVMARIAAALTAAVCLMILLTASAYLYKLSVSEKLGLARAAGIKNSYFMFGGMRHIFFNGFLAGLAMLGFYFLILAVAGRELSRDIMHFIYAGAALGLFSSMVYAAVFIYTEE